MNQTDPSSSLIATRLAAKSIITDLQMDDYNSNSSRQARFVEQQEADKKQELIDLSIQHQILSPFTAFIGVETRTEQENASVGEMILREVPIEIRANENSSAYDATSAGYNFMAMMQASTSSDEDMDEDCDDSNEKQAAFFDEEEDEDCDDSNEKQAAFSDEEEDEDCDDSDEKQVAFSDINAFKPVVALCRKKILIHHMDKCSRKLSLECHRMSRSRSRSRSPQQRRELHCLRRLLEDDISPSDIIRQIISLQNFSGFWSINNLKEISSLLQKHIGSKDVDLQKILNDYKDKDNDIILSMIIMFIFMKYFTDNESLWKPIIKKCAQAMESQLGKKEYNAMTDKIKQIV